MSDLPAIPDDDADFTPDLARKIVAKYQEIIRNKTYQLVKAREALRHANIDMSMLLPEIDDRDMQKSFRNTLDMIDALTDDLVKP